jgi:4-hydroxy-tetrahydrodipicolinate synthase
MGRKFDGVGVALVTPFNDDLSVDYDALGKLVRHVSDGGVDYLVVLGTTAESPTLRVSEKIEVLSCVQKHNDKNLPIVYGMGGNNTATLVEQYKAFKGNVDAFLVVTPYYNKPNQTGLLRHYQAIADVAPKPIILYNVPKRTGVNMEVDTVLELAKHPNIIGIKEASGDSVDQARLIAEGMPEDFLLTSGDDDLILPFIQVGGHGVISVVANALPEETSELVKLALDNGQEAQQVADQLSPMLRLIFKEGNPTGIKTLLKERGIGNGLLRLPLVEASVGLSDQIKSTFKSMDIKKGVA